MNRRPMTRQDRRRLGRDVRKGRRNGWGKQRMLAEHERAEQAWDRIRAAAAPALRALLASMSTEATRIPLIHNGRKHR